jgi:hypothetical protein
MEAKQRITVFCLTWGTGLVYLLCLLSVYYYIYMLIQHPTPLSTLILVTYGAVALGATLLCGLVWCDWHKRGRDKRSHSQTGDAIELPQSFV